MSLRLWCGAFTLDPLAPQAQLPQVLLAESREAAIGAMQDALGVTPTVVFDVTRELGNLLGPLLAIAREQRVAADGSKVYRFTQRDVVRRWLGESVVERCTSCGHAAAIAAAGEAPTP